MIKGGYKYRPKSRKELRTIADKILARFPSKRKEWSVDIESILEELGFEILFRPLRGIPVEAYIARNPRYIVVNQERAYFIPRYRFTLSEELAHRILEFNLWNNGDMQIPEGARVHELTEDQYHAIERDASALAAEILEPEEQFKERFAFHCEELKNQGVGSSRLKASMIEVSHDFEVSLQSAAFRAKVLGLITNHQYKYTFPPMM